MLTTNITALEASTKLANNNNARLIDVRSEEEWKEIGIPELVEKTQQLILLSWPTNHPQETIQEFVSKVSDCVKDKSSAVILICRSGVRSLKAANALQLAGYKECYNVIDGFEGSSSGPGWKNSGLLFKLDGNVCAVKR